MAIKTRYKDKNGEPIYLGDIVHVEEYPGKYVERRDQERRST